MEFFAVNNLKFLFGGYPCAGSSNAVAVNPMTSRVYVSCGAQTGGIVAYDGVALSKASAKIPTAPLASVMLGAQPTGLAVNPNTNRIYVVGMTKPTALDVLDGSTYEVRDFDFGPAGSIERSSDRGYNALRLPRPVAIDTRTNTIFVLNSVSSTISVFSGSTNTLTGTIAIASPEGAVISQPYVSGTLLSEIKPGNTFYNSLAGTITTLGGAIAMAVNESANVLYVAGVNGTVSVIALDPPAAPPVFSISGVIRDAQGVPAAGVAVRVSGAAVSTATVTDGTGLFVLGGLPAGSYTITPESAAYAFSPATLGQSLVDRNVGGLAFQANPPIVPNSYTLSPWTTIGAGVTTTAAVTLNVPAPAGGAVLTLSASDPKAAKVPATVTVPAGQSSVSFAVQGSGVSIATTVTLTAQYNGGTATASLTVAPGDKISVSSATYSQSSQLLTVTATDTNATAILSVLNANGNVPLGTMTNQGNGNFNFSTTVAAISSVNIKSNLGGSAVPKLKVVP